MVEDILAAGEVQTLGALQVHLVVGLKVSADQLPDRSIALDGFVQGPVYLPQRKAWSFDHHGDCVRHATLSTCEQVRDALAVGFDPSGYHVFLNDIDADSVLSLWLLLHPDRLRGKGRQRLLRLIDRLGRQDALGPASGRKHPLTPHLKPPPETPASLASLHQVLEQLDAWWSGTLDLPPRRASKVTAMWVDKDSLQTGSVVGGFAGLFERATAGIVYTAAPGDTYSYTVAKRSEFEVFDVSLFLRTCAEREPGWGGASTTGGGPRHPDGSRSRLEPEEVGAIFLQTWREPRPRTPGEDSFARGREFFVLFGLLLRATSTPSLIQMLSYHERWDLLCDLLLGHPQVRGESRPRDYPMGLHRRRAGRLVEILWETRAPCQPATRREKPPKERGRAPNFPHESSHSIRLLDVVAALRLVSVSSYDPLAEGEATQSPLGDQDLGRLLVGTLDFLVRWLFPGKCTCPKKPCVPCDNRQPAFERACRLLGLNHNEPTDFGWRPSLSGRSGSRHIGGWDRVRLDPDEDDELAAFRCFVAAWDMATLVEALSALGKSKLPPPGAGGESPVHQSSHLRDALRTEHNNWISYHRNVEGEQKKELEKECKEAWQHRWHNLARWRFEVLELKPVKVGNFLDRCEHAHTRRGASAWCSQSTARVRDELCSARESEPDGWKVLADSDAKIVLIASSRAPVDRSSVVRANEIEETIRAVLVYHDNHAVLGRRYPRLCEYLGDPKSKRIDPNLEGRVRYTNLLDFSLDATQYKKGFSPQPKPGDFLVEVDESERVRGLAREPCTEVKGEQRFENKDWWVPRWHQSETKSKKEQAYGLAATAYSLAGTVYRMVTSEEILSELERPGENGRQGRRLLAVATEMARLNKLGLPKEHLYTVLLDGDSFKELFVETPGLRRSGLSVRTELDLRHRWFDALRQLVEAKELEYLPVDLTYLGGDDLAFSLPKEHFPEFLECLAKSKPPGDLDLTYSFVAVERPARDPEAEVTAKAEEESEGDSQEEAARPDKLARKLLALVKLKRKEEPGEGQQVQLDLDGELKTVEWLGDGVFQGVIYPLSGDNQ